MMYEDLFDQERQSLMRHYFLEKAMKIGVLKKYKKNEIVSFDDNDFVGIVTKGILSKTIISLKGNVHALYLLRKGEVIGETYYFCGGMNNTTMTVKEDAEIAYMSRDLLEEELLKEPEMYRYFIHSITRKFRITMLQLTNNTFNDSMGKIADALLRLTACREKSEGKLCIDMIFTHQELANNIGCSRITVTNCLNRLQDEHVIRYEDKKIVIDDAEALKKYVDIITE